MFVCPIADLPFRVVGADPVRGTLTLEWTRRPCDQQWPLQECERVR